MRKCKVALRITESAEESKGYLIALINIENAGVYELKFASKDVKFQTGGDFYHFGDGSYFELNADDDDLKPHPVYEGVKYRELLRLNMPKVKCNLETIQPQIVIEYVRGDVPLHGHGSNVMEAYIAVEAPYTGEICGFGEKHKSFCKSQITIKQIWT